MIDPQILIDNNGNFVAIIDYTGQVYEGVLHYEPLSQYPIQIWSDSCCFITFLQQDDAEKLVSPTLPCPIQQPCCPQCLPSLMLLDVTGAGTFCSCLATNAYILEWNTAKQKYEFDYPGICDCAYFHAELFCSGSQWVCYLSLKNEIGIVCVDGVNLNFPINCVTMKGEEQLNFLQTGQCACGLCANEVLTIKFSPLP